MKDQLSLAPCWWWQNQHKAST